MAILNREIPIPTSGQSQIVDYTERSIAGNSYDLYVSPGYNGSIKNVFKLLNASFYFVASAVVANRTITILIRRVDKASNTHHQIIQATTGNIAATQDGLVVLTPIATLDGLTNSGVAVIATAELNKDLYLSGDDYIACGIGNGQAGDLYNVGLQLEYQNHIKGIREA